LINFTIKYIYYFSGNFAFSEGRTALQQCAQSFEGFMAPLPINLDVDGRMVVVVGGGVVAARKCFSILAAGGRLTVIAPTLDPSLAELRDQGRLLHLAREYAQGDLAGAFLVFAATDEAHVNRTVAEEAKRCAILADIADAPNLCSFTLPAVMRRGELQIAVSTGGKSPALARQIRLQLERCYGEEYGAAIELMGKIREKLLTEKGKSAYNKEIFSQLAERLPALIRDGAISEIDNMLKKLFGPEASLAGLGLGGKDTV
jgi:precorrin-2 dehydrogenase/sirohydrochlorin ferrochelatase